MRKQADMKKKKKNLTAQEKY